MNQQRELLARMIASPTSTLGPLTGNGEEVISVEELIGKDQANNGVFRIRTVDGHRALKVYSAMHNMDKYGWVGLLVHKYMADRGYSPTLERIVREESVNRLRERHPLLKQHLTPWNGFATIMQLIDIEVQLFRNKPTPEQQDKWNVPQLSRRVMDIGQALDTLGVCAIDAEFAIDRKGHLWLLDLDRFLFVDSWGRVHGFGTDGENGLLQRLLRLVHWNCKNNFQTSVIEQLDSGSEQTMVA